MNDSNLFVTMGIIICYLTIEIFPIFLVVDSNYMNLMNSDNKTDLYDKRQSLSEPLFDREPYLNKRSFTDLNSTSSEINIRL